MAELRSVLTRRAERGRARGASQVWAEAQSVGPSRWRGVAPSRRAALAGACVVVLVAAAAGAFALRRDAHRVETMSSPDPSGFCGHLADQPAAHDRSLHLTVDVTTATPAQRDFIMTAFRSDPRVNEVGEAVAATKAPSPTDPASSPPEVQQRSVEVRASDPRDLPAVAAAHHKSAGEGDLLLPDGSTDNVVWTNALEALLAPSLAPRLAKGFGMDAPALLQMYPHDVWARAYEAVRSTSPADLRQDVDSLIRAADDAEAERMLLPRPTRDQTALAERFASEVERRCALRAFRWPDNGQAPEQPAHPSNPAAQIVVASARCWVQPIQYLGRWWLPADVDRAAATGPKPTGWAGHGAVSCLHRDPHDARSSRDNGPGDDTSDHVIYEDDGTSILPSPVRFVPVEESSADLKAWLDGCR